MKELAAADGLTLDAELQRLVRRERQRRMGEALASNEPDETENAWLALGSQTIQKG